MTVNEAIVQADKLKPNMYALKEKVGWLNTLDGTIFRETVLAHERPVGAPEEFVPYDPDGDLEDVLIAPHPYDTVYVYWLQSQYDLNNAELAKYNTSAALYNQALAEFTAWYNRTHKPIRKILAIRI